LERKEISYVPLKERVFWGLSNHSYIYQFMQKEVFKTDYGSHEKIFSYFQLNWKIQYPLSYDYPLFLKQMPLEVKEAHYLFQELVLNINKLCIKNNCRLILVILPTKMEFSETLKNESYQPGKAAEYVENIAKEHSIPFLNLYQVLKAEKNPLRIFIKDEYHFNRNGHIFIAEKLYDFFSELKQ
jgi:hypothetical protein